MKKEFLIFPILFILVAAALYLIPKSNKAVLKVDNPCKIYVDINNNGIFDEKEPYIIEDLYYIDENSDLSMFPILSDLTEEQKVFLFNKVKEYSNHLLNKVHVKAENNDLLINGKSYKKLMLDSKLAFDDRDETQKALYDYVNSINTEDYVLLNTRSKKYHKLSCEEGRKSNNLKLVKLSEIEKETSPCKLCHNNKKKKKTSAIKTSQTVKKQAKHNILSTNKHTDIYETDNLKILFIDLNDIEKPSNKCTSTACKTLLQEIKNAKTSIDFAIYGINNQPLLIDALVQAKNRGVKVRWVYDINKSGGNYYEDNEKLAKLITTYNTDEDYENKNQTAIMHNKFFIFDNQKVWTGSANITTTDLSGFNANYAVLINSKELAQIYEKEFEQMYSGLFHKYKNTHNPEFIEISENIKIKPMFSPQDNILNSEIIPLINSAKDYIYMPMFFITHKGITNALINAQNRGVDVKIIQDATNSHSDSTAHKQLRTAGIEVKTENYAGKMHAKSVIIDDNITVIGSMNYTNSGNNKNDENVLIIKSPEITKYMKETFSYLWNKIPDKYLKFDPRAESFESEGSCYDGIDNNFDNKIDSEDEGCKAK